nr:hypothetical protein [Tanacetum cinerariifolium]
MERGFLASSDKKKKECRLKEKDVLVLGDLAKHVKNIEGKQTVPKGILKKAIRNVSADTHKVVVPLNDLGNVSKDTHDLAMNTNRVPQVSVDIRATADVAKSCASSTIHGNMRPVQEGLTSTEGCAINSGAAIGCSTSEVTKVPVWVKLYDVPILAYSEDGLSLIVTQIESTLKKEVTMAILEEEGDRYIKEVIRVEYEWKPPHCVEYKNFGHGPNLCPKRVREEVPKVPSMAAKSSTMEDNEEGFVEVKIRKKKKGDASRSFGGIRLPKPNSKVHWQQKKSVGSNGASNTTSSSVTTKERDKGVGIKVSSPSRANLDMYTLMSNSFDVLNAAEENVCGPSVQNPKVSEPIGNSSSNLNSVEAQDEGLWSRFKKAKENSTSKFSDLEDDSDEDEVYMLNVTPGGGFTGGLEDDFDCYDRYEAQALENARFCLKLKKLIAEHPDQEKLQSKRVKLEGVGYKEDVLPQPPGLQRISKSQRSSNSTASFGSNPLMYQEMIQQQYELDSKAKMKVIEQEINERMRLYHSQRIAEDMKVLQIDTRGMDPVDAAIINAQKARNLVAHKSYIRNRSWCLLWDFNVSLHADEKSTGSFYIDTGMRDFQECVDAIEMSDVNSTGLRFTWNQKPKGENGVLKKIDRIMANLGFYTSFSRPFKFSNILVHNTRFKDIVTNAWSISLLYDHGNLHENVTKLRHELDTVQIDLDRDPDNIELREEEAAYLLAFNKASLLEENFLMQKAKVEWLKLGNANTAYFHKVVKSQAIRNRIDSITTTHGLNVDGDQEIKEWVIIELRGRKELNHTILALIPKVNTPMRVNDYRPISCCDVLYKCISKIISNRIKESLTELVSLNMSAFVPGRRISDNILLTQELMHNYHLDRGAPRCTFKVDIQKACDTVDWGINGSLHGYFKGKRGLRQGDPMSPYLFTLVMEVLTLMLNRKACEYGNFTYHRYCSKLNLINLCFADDLFLFAHGDVDSARVIMDTLGKFKDASGLAPILLKSTTYFCKVLNHIKIDILNILPFEEGEMKKGKAKVAWEVVCLPKREGGLGIRRLEVFNKALITSHIWSLLSHKESLWVKCIHTYKLNGRSFWEIPIHDKLSWGWRKILQVRQLVRPYFWYRLGDDANASAWFDNWCSVSPFADIISNRDIYGAGFNRSAKIQEDVEGSVVDTSVEVASLAYGFLLIMVWFLWLVRLDGFVN